MAVAIFYGSNGGATEDVAKLISQQLEEEKVETVLIDISDATKEDFDRYTEIIIGSSTWGEGELQDDWESFFDTFKTIDFSGKIIALFGLGDQDGYPDNFCDAIGILYQEVIKNGGSVIGHWPTDGYDFDESIAVQDGEFVGLCIDEDNQDDLTKKRVAEWVLKIKDYFD